MEFLSIFGILAIALFLYQNSVIKQLKHEVRLIKGNLKKQGSEEFMSNVLSGLIGSKCKLVFVSDLNFKATSIEVSILEADDNFLKFAAIDKHGNGYTKIIRTDDIIEIHQLNSNNPTI